MDNIVLRAKKEKIEPRLQLISPHHHLGNVLIIPPAKDPCKLCTSYFFTKCVQCFEYKEDTFFVKMITI